ncbi:MAG: hypothetical protein AVDCRST_MAG93-4936 [uncultured Chloroflexia bacterium]|uniref:BON domain-containing protein n=1 Tax=uncultured Chloroflexia bacterium TaxID=1672391 RepID=A0A6J4KJT8_9CHLR|nr:MAG: hypothetical protein AVDCRST_MAG93-4936 [uncultured Chloroflexia bacterium]
MTDRTESGLHTPQHDSRQEPQPYINPPQDEDAGNEFLDQLAGVNVEGTAYIDQSDVDQLEQVTMTDVYEGETDSNQELAEGGLESYDLLIEQELRDGETDDVMEAIEQGYTYIPPIDPPVTTDYDDPQSIQIAAGFGTTGDEASDVSGDPSVDQDDVDRFHERGDDMTAFVRGALRADSSTTHLADRLQIATINGTVIVRGTVDDLDDTDNIVAVISDLAGVESVRDETIVAGL